MAENTLQQWTRSDLALNPLASRMECYFNDYCHANDATGIAAPVVTDANTNIYTFGPNTLYISNINAQTQLPIMAATGLDISCDATATDGVEINLVYPAASNAAARFLFGPTGTEKRAFFLEVKATLQDVSGVGEFVVGFRKTQAYAAARATYTDYAAILIDGTKVETIEQVATGGETLTDSAKTVGDGAAYIARVEVDENGKVYFKHNLNPTTGLLVTTGVFYTVPKAPDYSFTNTLTLTPFIRFIQDVDISTMTINYVKCGYLG